IETAYTGQHDVDEDDVGRVAPKRVQPLLTRGGFVDPVSLFFQREPDGDPDAGVVLDDEDGGRHTAMMPRGVCRAGATAGVNVGPARRSGTGPGLLRRSWPARASRRR